MKGSEQHHARHAGRRHQRLDLLISLPAVFRGIGLKTLDPGNINYLPWAIIGYMIATAVLVVAFGISVLIGADAALVGDLGARLS